MVVAVAFVRFFRVAGTAGAIVTCPLEVVKTRLQSSSSGFYPPPMNKELASGHVTCKSFPKAEQRRRLCTGGYTRYLFHYFHCNCANATPNRRSKRSFVLNRPIANDEIEIGIPLKHSRLISVTTDRVSFCFCILFRVTLAVQYIHAPRTSCFLYLEPGAAINCTTVSRYIFIR